MIKPGIYTIEAVEKYHSLLLTGEHETGTPEELRRRARLEADKITKHLIKDCAEAEKNFDKAEAAYTGIWSIISAARRKKVRERYILAGEVLHKAKQDLGERQYMLRKYNNEGRQSIAEDALKELQSTVEDPAVADPYYNIREKGRELNRLMRQVQTPLGWLMAQMKDLVEMTADKTDDVFTYPTQIFMISCMHARYPDTLEAIERCHASLLKLAAAVKECNESCHIFRRDILDEIPQQLIKDKEEPQLTIKKTPVTKEERLQDEIDKLLEDIEKIKDEGENRE